MAVSDIRRDAQLAEAEKGAAIDEDFALLRMECLIERRAHVFGLVGDGVLVLTVKAEHGVHGIAGWLQVRPHMRIDVAIEAIFDEAEMGLWDFRWQIAAQKLKYLEIRFVRREAMEARPAFQLDPWHSPVLAIGQARRKLGDLGQHASVAKAPTRAIAGDQHLELDGKLHVRAPTTAEL